MRSRGEGTFFFSASEDRWVGRIGPITVKAKDREMAKEKWQAAKERHTQGGRTSTAPTIGELWAALIDKKRKEKKTAGTVEWYEVIGRKHIKPIAGWRADQVTVRDIEDWADKRRGVLGDEYLRKLVNALAQAIDIAMRRREITWNPARMVPTPSSEREDIRPPDQEVLTYAEVDHLLTAVAGDRLEAWLHLILNTGMRPHETYGLRWDDVDLGELHITARPRKAKTKRPRVLEISPRTRTHLSAHRSAQTQERLIMGPMWPAAHDQLVFRSEAGTPLDGHNMNRKLSHWLTTAKIKKPLTVYNLRKTVATLAADSGVLLVTLADFLGSNPRTVERYYRKPVAPVRSIGMDLAAAAADHRKGT